MDINDWRGISTILVMAAFIGICWWAFSPARRQRFDEAANLPFADEPDRKEHREKPQQSGQQPDGDGDGGDNRNRAAGPATGKPAEEPSANEQQDIV